jgi:uncharacterized lipoprotein NlpE involved in copper resistance
MGYLKKHLLFLVFYIKFGVEAIMPKNVFFYSLLMAALLLSGLSGCATKKVVDAAHNSKNSLDWAGVYTGIIPAGDTAGVELRITLNYDETYEAEYQFAGKPETRLISAGMFNWNDEGNIIKLDIEHIPPYYAVAENKLIQLDMNGKIISGSLADKYILKKGY